MKNFKKVNACRNIYIKIHAKFLCFILFLDSFYDFHYTTFIDITADIMSLEYLQ